MNHRKTGRHFGRPTAHREAMMCNLAISLIEHEKIKTTVAKAKELRGVVERLITRSKQDSVANRRLVDARIRNKGAVAKLFKEIGPRYKERAGGYTRIFKCGFRAGDNAPLALIELV